MRQILLSSAIPFPPLSWWVQACRSSMVVLDMHEHYQKMSYRNRYYLAGPQGRQLMSFPLEKGRNQREPMMKVRTTQGNWPLIQEKTLRSLYHRAPFFDYYEQFIIPLIQHKEDKLFIRNKQSIECINQLLNLNIEIRESEAYRSHYDASFLDIRTSYRPQKIRDTSITYMQVFEERTGFLPDCSILDLLFCEGRMAEVQLKEAAAQTIP